jgi:hypothetical protein
MAFTGNAMCTSFKVELLKGVHNFSTGGNTFKLALYTATATLSASTTAYSATNEVGNSGSYAAGGGALTKRHAHFVRHDRPDGLRRPVVHHCDHHGSRRADLQRHGCWRPFGCGA